MTPDYQDNYFRKELKIRILIGCEFSQIVTKAFRDKGHEAFSCDLLPTEGNPDWHIQGDILEVLKRESFDLGIFHPPCTYLAKCGLHYLKTRPERLEKHRDAVKFFLSLYNAPINHIAIENPEGWLNTNWRKPDQIIQPYYFGDPEVKTTCLWLKNLPLLQYKLKDDLFGEKTALDRPKPKGFVLRKTGRKIGQKYNYYFRAGKTGKERSRSFQGIAEAMATQWSDESTYQMKLFP